MPCRAVIGWGAAVDGRAGRRPDGLRGSIRARPFTERNVGAGIRYTLAKGKCINARLNYASGVNGNDGLYLGIMEAF